MEPRAKTELTALPIIQFLRCVTNIAYGILTGMIQGERGYTLLEVMIFLAITGVLFVSAVVVLGGQQRRVQFNQGMRDINSKIQDYINDVSSGYYLNANQYLCDTSGIGGAVTVSVSGNKDITPGDAKCIFVGKAMQLAPEGSYNQLLMHTVLGNAFRITSDGFTPRVTGIGDTSLQPKSIAGTPTGDDPAADLTETYTLPWGITIDSNPSHTKTGLIVFASNFSGNSTSGTGGAQQVAGVIFRDGSGTGQFNPGSNRIDAYAVLANQSNYSQATTNFKAETDPDIKKTWGQICFRDSSGTQVASINFTSDKDDGQLVTELLFDNTGCES